MAPKIAIVFVGDPNAPRTARGMPGMDFVPLEWLTMVLLAVFHVWSYP